jgi:hypothetical protein
MTKVCSKCKIEKDLSEFYKDKNKHWCKKCFNIYRKSKSQLVTTIYSHQKSRTKEKGYPLPTYTKNELKEWLYSQPKFHKLYDNWKRLDFQKDYTPSVDRKNDYLGYSIANIQLMTWRENLIKVGEDVKNGKNNKRNKIVFQYDLDDNLLKEYYSISHAARKTNSIYSNIIGCCKGKYKTTNGFKWKYK